MKKSILALIVLSISFLAACATSGNFTGLYEENAAESVFVNTLGEGVAPVMTIASALYMTFEEALVEFATDIVIVQYVDSRPFGQNLTEFEFIVLDRILGNAADRIFVYANTNIPIRILDHSHHVHSHHGFYTSGNLEFTTNTSYLLPLEAIGLPHANTHEDGFVFVKNIVIDLSDPSQSIMYNELLSQHSTAFDFDGYVSEMELVSFMRILTQNNSRERDFIRVNEIEVILKESPYILVVEINEPLRLVNEQVSTDWMSTDIYYITILEVLKGEVAVDYEAMIFFANTVQTGQKHIISAQPMEIGNNWLMFSSRNGLHSMNQRNEIIQIIENLYNPTLPSQYFTLTFDLGDWDDIYPSHINPILVREGVEILPLLSDLWNQLSREGYELSGWIKVNNQNQEHHLGSGDTMPSNNLTLFAQWSPIANIWEPLDIQLDPFEVYQESTEAQTESTEVDSELAQ